MTVELPRWSLADRVTVALVVAAGIVVEAVAAGRDGAPSGAGLGRCGGPAVVACAQPRASPAGPGAPADG